ncbi:MAG: hypothetical protein ACRDHG_07070 [Anaerolineales bacterium]
MGSGRSGALILIVLGIAIAGIGTLYVLSQLSSGELQTGGAVVGIGILGLPALLAIGIGVALLARSREVAAGDMEQAQLRKILDMVKSKGQVPISELVIDLGSTRKAVQDQVHSLVGMGLFSGYINWDEGTLYSAEAAELRKLERCKKCGGEVSFAGKGVLVCKYCGTEYFLS